jgi:hypothetical protein
MSILNNSTLKRLGGIKPNNPVNVNSGSGMILKHKALPDFYKYSNNKFTINGNHNQNYIGNPNTALSYLACKTSDSKPKISVKSYSGYLKTRIVNNHLKCNVINSKTCQHIPQNINKHFNNNINKDSDSRIRKLKNKVLTCEQNRCDQYINKNYGCSNNYKKNIGCNVTKGYNCINGFTPDYSIYQPTKCVTHSKTGKNDCIGSTSNANCELYNPVDAKVIAC